jgi:phage head maturation protease
MNSNLFYRSNPLVTRRKGGGLTLSFSSEAPVKRWFGPEILLHNAQNVDLTRLQAVGALLYGHDASRLENIVGKIARAWLEDRKGKADVVFDSDQSGTTALDKVTAGSLKGVSVGYMINEARQLEDNETWTDPDSGQTFDGPGMIATKWTPYEISLTPIPADPSVGVGRELTRSLDGIHITTSTTTRKEHQIMDTEAIKTLAAKILESVRHSEKERWDLIGHARMISAEAAAYTEQALKEGRSIEEMQRTLLDMAGIVPGARLNQTGTIRSFKQITDDEFFRALADPAPNSLDAVTPQGGRRSFKEISDDEFFAGISNPAEYNGGR